jgi:hypothetical protein
MVEEKKSKKVILNSVLGVLVLIAIGLGIWLFLHRGASPVPKNIKSAVSFPIYYPDQKKLPDGYTLDINSFKNPVKDGVAYLVRYGAGKKLVFSLQNKPLSADLQQFNSNFIPLHNELRTDIGTAEIGAYNAKGSLQTLISLPTNESTWIIITAPPDVNQDQLKHILKSIRS